MKKHLVFFLLSSFGLLAITVNGQKKQTVKAHLNHVAIFVVDLQKSADFYMHVIGLDTVPEPFHDGKHVWLQIAPNVQMHIIQGAPEKKSYYKNQHSCFSVASVETFAKMLTIKQIAFEDRDGKQSVFTTRVDGVKQIWLQDPDGYWVEINDAKD